MNERTPNEGHQPAEGTPPTGGNEPTKIPSAEIGLHHRNLLDFEFLEVKAIPRWDKSALACS